MRPDIQIHGKERCDMQKETDREPDKGRHGENMLRVSDIPGPGCRVIRESGKC